MSYNGIAFLRRHTHGKSLTATEAILAKCASCMNDYVDGRRDCETTDCPLYPWMPYGSKPRKKCKRGYGNKGSEK